MTDFEISSVEPTLGGELIVLSEPVTSENSLGNDGTPAGEGPYSAELLSTLEACRTRFQAAAGRYRTDLYENLVPTYRAGLCVRSDPVAWLLFQQAPGWQQHKGRKPKLEDQDDALFFAVMSVFGGTSRAANRKASAFASALWLMARERVLPEALVEVIESRGGTDALAREAATARKQLTAEAEAERRESDPPAATRTKPVTLKVKAAPELAARLVGRTLYLVTRENGQIAVSVDPNSFESPNLS